MCKTTDHATEKCLAVGGIACIRVILPNKMFVLSYTLLLLVLEMSGDHNFCSVVLNDLVTLTISSSLL